jgi:dipeptidyl aminopeptidase/acylaminoacyl peptidase
VEAMKSETGGSDEALRSRSVVYFAENIKMPALILNGARDDRTDAGQAIRLAEAINSHGGHARTIVYPQFGHNIPVEVRNKDVEPFIEQVLGR